MKIEIQGEGVFDVPDDATPEEIDQITRPVKPAAAAKAPPSATSRAAKSLGETAADAVTGSTSIASIADPVLAAAGAAGSYLVPGTGEGSFGDRFHNEMEGLRRRRAEAFTRSPVAATAGALAPAVVAPELLAKMPAPFSQSASAASGTLPFLGRAAAGAADAALYTGAQHAAEHVDQPDTSKTLGAMMSPTNLVGALPAALMETTKLGPQAKIAFAEWLRQHGPKVTPTPEALRLEAQGVPLTLGQMNPKSTIGQLEAVSEHNPMGLKPQREAAKDVWRDQVRRTALPPGDTTELPPEPDDAMKAIYDAFAGQYGPIRAQPVPAEAIAGMPEAATRMPGNIDARTKAGVRREVENALTVLPESVRAPAGPPQPVGVMRDVTAAGPEGVLESSVLPRTYPGTNRPAPAPPGGAPEWKPVFENRTPPPEMTAGDVMKVRENIRGQIRDARKAQDFDQLKLLEHAEDVVSGVLEGNLSPETSAALKATDRRYAIYNVIEDAASRAGLQGNFSPKQLGAAAKSSAGRRAFVHGGAPDSLVQTAQDADRVFLDAPLTGFRGAVIKAVPYGEKLAAPLMHAANSPTFRAALLDREIPRLMTPAPQYAARPGVAGPMVNPFGESPEATRAFLDWLRARVPSARPALAGADDRGGTE